MRLYPTFYRSARRLSGGKNPKERYIGFMANADGVLKIGLSTLPMTIDQKHVDYVVNNTKNEDHHTSRKC